MAFINKNNIKYIKIDQKSIQKHLMSELLTAANRIMKNSVYGSYICCGSELAEEIKDKYNGFYK